MRPWGSLAADSMRALVLGAGVWTLAVACLGSALAEQGAGRLAVVLAALGGLLLNLVAPRLLVPCLSERAWGALGLGVAALLALSGVLWAMAYSSMQGSDFGVYYSCGVYPAPDLESQIAHCQGRYMPANLVYWGRSLLYSIPLGALFGDAPEAFDLANAFYQGSALILLFHVMRRAFSAPAALVAVLAWGLLPERIYAVTLVTSDNLVALAVVGTLAVAIRRRIGPTETLVLALLLLAIGLLRNAAPIFGLALLAGSIAIAGGLKWRRVLGVTAALGLYALFAASLGAGLPLSDDSRDLLKLVSAVDLTSVQDYGTGSRWVYDLLPAVPAGEQRALELRALATELTHHLALYPGYIAAKAGLLTGGSGYATFASLDLSANADTVLTVPRSDVPLPGNYPLVYRTIATFTIGMALAGLLVGPQNGLHLTAGAVVALFFLPFYLYAEVQARYLFMPGIALAVLSGSAWASGQGEGVARRLKELVLGVLAIGLVLAAVVLALTLARGQIQTPLAAARLVATSDCPTGGASLVPGLQRTRLELPLGVACAAIGIPMGAETRSVSFLIARPEPALLRGPLPETGIAWRILAPDSSEHRGGLGTAAARWYRLHGPPEGAPGSLTLVFSRSTTDAAQVIDLANLSIDR